MSEVNRIIQDLEFCDSLFDYTLTPDDSGLLLGYIQDLQQENQQLNNNWNELKEWLKKEKSTFGSYRYDEVLNKMEILDKVKE